jgi:hypothetical protein
LISLAGGAPNIRAAKELLIEVATRILAVHGDLPGKPPVFIAIHELP